MAKVKPIPEGYHTLTPYVAVRDAVELIDFLKQVFDASETERHARPDGTIMHAEVRIGDSAMMISEACDQMGPMPAHLYLYVEDADATYQKALEAGATSTMEPTDMFWGDRFASVKDSQGNTWSIATHIEDLTSDEVQQRAQAFFEQSSPQS